MTNTLQDKLNEVLDQFEKSIPSVEATALFDMDGLVIASRLKGGVDDQRIGAMAAAILSISSRSGDELERGTLERVLIEGEKGSMVIMSVGAEIVLVALVGKQVKLGILFYECRRCIAEIMGIMGYQSGAGE
jgi:predicted regulator of Ras-like GTPase activity (Roadblock/LC7/MglB family)